MNMNMNRFDEYIFIDAHRIIICSFLMMIFSSKSDICVCVCFIVYVLGVRVLLSVGLESISFNIHLCKILIMWLYTNNISNTIKVFKKTQKNNVASRQRINTNTKWHLITHTWLTINKEKSNFLCIRGLEFVHI